MEVLNHIFYFNMGLNCPTEVVSQFSIFSPNTPLQDHCAKVCSFHTESARSVFKFEEMFKLEKCSNLGKVQVTSSYHH